MLELTQASMPFVFFYTEATPESRNFIYEGWVETDPSGREGSERRVLRCLRRLYWQHYWSSDFPDDPMCRVYFWVLEEMGREGKFLLRCYIVWPADDDSDETVSFIRTHRLAWMDKRRCREGEIIEEVDDEIDLTNE